VIYEEDHYGNVLTGDNSSVITAAVSGGSGQLQGATATVSGGVSRFANLTDFTAETAALTFTNGSLVSVPTPSITVSPAAAYQLAIHTEPSPTAAAGSAFSIQPVIYEEDRYNNIETGDNSTVVTAALKSGAGPLQGAALVTVSGGIATFTDLGDNTAETIALGFSATGVSSATSNAIAVSAGTLSKLVIHTQPSSTAMAGVAFQTQPVVYEEDKFGNVETGDNSTAVTASLASGVGPLQGSVTAVVSGGIATFTSLADDLAETITLNFSVGNLTAGASNEIVVSAAEPAKLVMQSQPSPTATAGVAFQTQPVVYEEDQFGNLETDDNMTVVAVSPATGAGPLQGTQSVMVAGGVATFTNLADTKAETITLKFTSVGLTPAISDPIVVTAGAATHLAIVSPPPGTINPGAAFGLQVAAEDAFGNVNLTFNGPVTVALASNPGSSTLKGTRTVTAASGVATFSGLSLSNAGTGYTVQATSVGLNPGTTTPFNIATIPTITSEKAVSTKTTLSFTFQYSTAMNAGTAGVATNYQVEAFSTKKVNNKTVKVTTTVHVKAAYNQSKNLVTLTVIGKNPFSAGGGQIKILATSAKSGVSSKAGVLLSPKDTLFAISAKGSSIKLG
jgi:hypothetical protein